MSVAAPARSHRRILIWSAVAVAIAVLGVAVNRWFAGNSIPEIEPFDVGQFLSISVKSERNAIPVYCKAAAGFVDQGAFMASATLARQNAFPTSCNAAPKDWKLANADVRGWLEANRPAMEIWKQGSQLDDALDVPPDRMNIVTDSSLSTDAARTFTRLALLEAARLRVMSSRRGIGIERSCARAGSLECMRAWSLALSEPHRWQWRRMR